MTTAYRLPVTDTIALSFEAIGIAQYELGEDFPYDYAQSLDIQNLYSICECTLLSPLSGEIEEWYLIRIQDHFPYAFRPGRSYRELTLYLCNKEVDPRLCLDAQMSAESVASR